MNRKERYESVLNHYRERMPHVSTELEFGSVFQLLVATVLSAQCTDKRINQVTPELFRRFPDAQAMAKADVEEVLEYVKSVSYPNTKSQHLVDMARMMVEQFGGKVPQDMKDLMKLPGVGRKTANVIQAVGFGRSAIAVDTHVYRVSHRLGLVSPKANTPVKVEEELKKYIPEEDRADAHHWLLLHGRYICQSRMPRCGECPFDGFCPKLLKGSKVNKE
ncbi:MAG: endonuclease III [Prevotella sp.]|nr:endonuclease III [Prevotella sp.]